jgi:imidazoleglycerol-phosphate dehydratase
MAQVQKSRKTKETDIFIELRTDGDGVADIRTGIAFFDHMLTAMCVHGELDLLIKATGDLDVDCHHTVEDVGIVLGMALSEALGNKKGILRYGSCFLPMDESLAFTCVDVSGRPFLVFEADFKEQSLGEMNACMVEEFFRAFSTNAGITLHAKVLYGKNGHHMAEALFKSLGVALRNALMPNRGGSLLSTKGVLE